MASMNKVILIGNLTRDVELRAIGSGAQVANIGLAVNRRWRDAQGEQKDEVTFIDCEVWGKSAETIAKYVGKGDPLLIEGRLKLEQWQDKVDGSNRSKLKVVVEMFGFLGSKGERSEDAKPQSAQTPTRSSQKFDRIEEEEIPF